MFEKLQLKIKKYLVRKDKLYLYGAVFLTVLFSIWAFIASPVTKQDVTEPGELSTSIPQGFSIVPIELSNSQGLSGMINKNAIIDVFLSKHPLPLLENLRVIKLSAGEGPAFGALIPEHLMGNIQDILSRPGLRGVLKPVASGTTRLHFAQKKKQGFNEITIREDL